YYDIPMQFTDKLKNNVIGTCYRWWGPDFREIKIDQAYWVSASKNERISLVFHELAHCDINRDHDEAFLTNGWPRSLMYPYNIYYPLDLANFRDYYFTELFN